MAISPSTQQEPPAPAGVEADVDAATFIANVFDRAHYQIGATETGALVRQKGENAWISDEAAHGLADAHTHYTCGLFEFNTSETVNDFRRKKDRWTGAVGVVLDDIGEEKNGKIIKAPPVKPTVIIQTKPNSQQWIYLFTEIERDANLINTIYKSAIAAGMCDPGAGNVTRLSRIPGRIPLGKKHAAQVVYVDWSRRFNSKVLIEKGLQVPVVVPQDANIDYAAPIFSTETSEHGQAALDRAVAAILNVGGTTGSNEMFIQGARVGEAVGRGEIEQTHALSALISAAQQRHPTPSEGARNVKNGLTHGIKTAIPIKVEPKTPKADPEAEAKALAQAQKRVSEALPRMQAVTDTPAEKYLRSRGLKSPYPSVDILGYAGKDDDHFVVFVGRDRNGAPSALHTIKITEDGKPYINGSSPIQTVGKIDAAPVKIPATSDDPRLFICKSPEAALTINKAIGAEVWAVTNAALFSGIRKKHDIAKDRTIVLCPDADPAGSPEHGAFDKGWKEWITCENSVYIAHSGFVSSPGADLNTTLTARDMNAVKRRISNASPIHVPVDEARAQLDRVMQNFADGAQKRLYVGVTVGVGKTQTAIQRILAAIDIKTQFAVYASPMHALNDQTADDIRKVRPELRVASRRGVDATDAHGEPMCNNLEEYQEAARMLLNPKEHVCEDCPLADGCAYLAQEDLEGHIYQLSHSGMAGAKGVINDAQGEDEDGNPERVMSAMVVDESFAPSPALTAVKLGAILAAPYESAKPDPTQSAIDLRISRDCLRGIIDEHFDPTCEVPLTKDMLRRRFVDCADDEAIAKTLAGNVAAEWGRKYEPAKGMPVDYTKAVLNKTVRPLARIWSLMAEFMRSDEEVSPKVSIKMVQDSAAIAAMFVPGLQFKEPLATLDATGSIEMQEAVIGKPYTHAIHIHAQQPNLWIEQDWTQRFSKAWASDQGNVLKLIEYLRDEAAAYQGPILVVGNKSLAEKLRNQLPPHVAVRHFNALRGDNSFKTYRRVIVVGRPMPSNVAVEEYVRAYKNRFVEGGFGSTQQWRPVIQPDGSVACQSVTVAGYQDDPFANHVIEQIVAAEINQTIGRARAVNSDEPVLVTVLGDVVLQSGYEALPVHPVDVPWAARFNRCPIAEQIDAGGVAFQSGSLAQEAYPQLFNNAEAAKKLLRRHADGCHKCGAKVRGHPSIGKIWLKLASDPEVANSKVRGHPSIKVLIERCPLTLSLAEKKFRRAGSKGGPPAIALTASPETIKQDITRVLGAEPVILPTIEKENI